MGLEDLDIGEVLQMLARAKIHALLSKLDAAHKANSEIDVARAWFSVCKGYWVIPFEGKEDADHEEDKLKLVGLIEDGETYKLEFETTRGDLVQLGGKIHKDYVLVSGQDFSVLDASDTILRILGEKHKPSEGESPISHLLH